MGDISVFVPEDKEFLIGVFYKVGVWISNIDDDGEEHADEKEEKVLMTALEHISKKYKKNPLISQLSGEAARQTGNHQRWSDASDNAVEDATKGAKLIKQQMSPEDLKAYREALREVARAVATAFREGEGDEGQGVLSKIKSFSSKLINKEMHLEQNISPDEDTALIELYDSLHSV